MSFKSTPESFNLIRVSGRICGLSIFLVRVYLSWDKNDGRVIPFQMLGNIVGKHLKRQIQRCIDSKYWTTNSNALGGGLRSPSAVLDHKNIYISQAFFIAIHNRSSHSWNCATLLWSIHQRPPDQRRSDIEEFIKDPFASWLVLIRELGEWDHEMEGTELLWK